jgi:hypothetical protein
LILSTVGCSSTKGEEWSEIHRRLDRSVWASSELEESVRGRKVRYGAGNAVDGSRDTCWVEGAPGDGKGETITIVTNRPIEIIEIVNGFARDTALYRKNNRVRRLSVSIVAAFTAPGLVSETDHYLYFAKTLKARNSIELEDVRDPQVFAMPLTSEEQDEFVQQSMERFLEDYPDFSEKIEEELGYAGDTEMSGRRLAAFFREVRELYSMTAVQLEIEDVYRGDLYNDTCLAEIDVKFAD